MKKRIRKEWKERCSWEKRIETRALLINQLVEKCWVWIERIRKEKLKQRKNKRFFGIPNWTGKIREPNPDSKKKCMQEGQKTCMLQVAFCTRDFHVR